jgi:hypothetical protein
MEKFAKHILGIWTLCITNALMSFKSTLGTEEFLSTT